MRTGFGANKAYWSRKCAVWRKDELLADGADDDNGKEEVEYEVWNICKLLPPTATTTAEVNKTMWTPPTPKFSQQAKVHVLELQFRMIFNHPCPTRNKSESGGGNNKLTLFKNVQTRERNLISAMKMMIMMAREDKRSIPLVYCESPFLHPWPSPFTDWKWRVGNQKEVTGCKMWNFIVNWQQRSWDERTLKIAQDIFHIVNKTLMREEQDFVKEVEILLEGWNTGEWNRRRRRRRRIEWNADVLNKAEIRLKSFWSET